LDGLLRVIQQEGVHQLFSGCSTATLRAILMTIGQLSFYDQIKMMLLQSGYFKDNPSTHVLSSVSAVSIHKYSNEKITYVRLTLRNVIFYHFLYRALLQQHLHSLWMF